MVRDAQIGQAQDGVGAFDDVVSDAWVFGIGSEAADTGCPVVFNRAGVSGDYEAFEQLLVKLFWWVKKS